MKKPAELSRRAFLSKSSSTLGSGWLAAQWPALLAAASVACSRSEPDAAYTHISVELGDTLSAMAEQIIPSGENSPGAREAGVIWFMDAWLGGGGEGMVGMLTDGARGLDDIAGGPGRFAQMDFDEQTSALKQIESGEFFNVVRLLTIAGMFAMPKHGGNKDKTGWKLVGFEDQHAWQPPFGHYDAVAGRASEEESA